jgi:arylsulfatase A-like enzyme
MHWLCTALAAALLGLPAAAAPGGFGLGAPGSAKGLNLLVVTLDTTRADRLGCYGHKAAATPTLDALAARGLRFTQATSTVPVTLPSHATMFTGFDPPHHGVRNNSEYRLAASHETLAERLRAAGYDTAAFVAAFVLDARFGLDQGFAHYDDRVEAAQGAAFAQGNNERRADAVTDAALAWLGRERRAPFFAWVHYYDAHATYRPPAPHDARFKDAPYDGEIAFMDAQLARLLRALDERRLRERTLVVVLADHGESLGEHGEATHGVFVYESVLRIPLIVAGPPAVVPKPTVIDGLVSTVDLTPTVLDLLGVPSKAEFDGLSWASAKPDRRRVVYVESLLPYLDYGWAPLFGLRRPHDKYILAPRPEYYDLTADPAEKTDLRAAAKGERRATVERLATIMRAALERQPALAAPTNTQEAEVGERLRALGYVGGAGPENAGRPSDAASAGLADPKDMIPVAVAVVDANARLMGGRPQEALKLALGAAQRSPRDRTVLQLLGKIYLRLGQVKEAEKVLREFTAIRPKSDVSLLLAQILILDGRLDEAGRLLDEAEKLDPAHGGVLIARGDLLAKRGQTAQARAAYERAAQVDPYRAAGAATARLKKLEAGAKP